jgi:hypothetical protein
LHAHTWVLYIGNLLLLIIVGHSSVPVGSHYIVAAYLNRKHTIYPPCLPLSCTSGHTSRRSPWLALLTRMITCTPPPSSIPATISSSNAPTTSSHTYQTMSVCYEPLSTWPRVWYHALGMSLLTISRPRQPNQDTGRSTTFLSSIASETASHHNPSFPSTTIPNPPQIMNTGHSLTRSHRFQCQNKSLHTTHQVMIVSRELGHSAVRIRIA